MGPGILVDGVLGPFVHQVSSSLILWEDYPLKTSLTKPTAAELMLDLCFFTVA